MYNNFVEAKSKSDFVQSIIDRKAEFKTEEDALLLKRTEMAYMRKYNTYRAPFLAVSMTVCLLAASNSTRGLTFRFLPTIMFVPFIILYNDHIGMYGVRKEIDSILDVMAGENIPKAEKDG